MKPLPLTLMAGAVLISATALAADAKFEAADTDGNGVLTMAELVLALPDTTPEAFTLADVDKSGTLTEAEYITAVNEGLLPEG